MSHQKPEVSRVAPYFQRAAIAQNELDRSRFMLPEFIAHGCSDCLDALEFLPTGGYALSTVIGSYAYAPREGRT